MAKFFMIGFVWYIYIVPHNGVPVHTYCDSLWTVTYWSTVDELVFRVASNEASVRKFSIVVGKKVYAGVVLNLNAAVGVFDDVDAPSRVFAVFVRIRKACDGFEFGLEKYSHGWFGLIYIYSTPFS